MNLIFQFELEENVVPAEDDRIIDRDGAKVGQE